MYTADKQDKFIELRAQGWSFSHIANELYVSKRTLIEWSHEFDPDIKSLRNAGVQLLREKVATSREEQLDRLLRFQKDVEDELAERPLGAIPLEKLFQIACELRRQIKDMVQEPPQHEQPFPAVTEASADPDTGASSSTSRPGPLTRRPVKARSTTSRTAESIENQNATTDEHATSPLGGLLNGDSTDKKATANNEAPHQNGASDPVPLAPQPQPSQQAALEPAKAASPTPQTPAPPALSKTEKQPTAPTPQKAPQEVCLACGANLPPLLPNGQQPSHYCCECGHSLSLPGLNLPESCPHCSRLLPVHGYNTERLSDTCPGCGAKLPPLDPKANPPWLPEHMRANLPVPKKP